MLSAKLCILLQHCYKSQLFVFTAAHNSTIVVGQCAFFLSFAHLLKSSSFLLCCIFQRRSHGSDMFNPMRTNKEISSCPGVALIHISQQFCFYFSPYSIQETDHQFGLRCTVKKHQKTTKQKQLGMLLRCNFQSCYHTFLFIRCSRIDFYELQ